MSKPNLWPVPYRLTELPDSTDNGSPIVNGASVEVVEGKYRGVQGGRTWSEECVRRRPDTAARLTRFVERHEADTEIGLRWREVIDTLAKHSPKQAERLAYRIEEGRGVAARDVRNLLRAGVDKRHVRILQAQEIGGR